MIFAYSKSKIGVCDSEQKKVSAIDLSEIVSVNSIAIIFEWLELVGKQMSDDSEEYINKSKQLKKDLA